MGDECVAVGGMRIGGENGNTPKELPQVNSVDQEFHTNLPGFEPGPPWWEAGD
jgi:hypothetical protein